MIEQRHNSRALPRFDDRTARAISVARWAQKRADAERGAPLLAAMDKAGVNSLAELQALQGSAN